MRELPFRLGQFGLPDNRLRMAPQRPREVEASQKRHSLRESPQLREPEGALLGSHESSVRSGRLENQNRSLEVPFRRHTGRRNKTKLRRHLTSMVFRRCVSGWTRNDAWRLRCSTRLRLPVSERAHRPSAECAPPPSYAVRTPRLPTRPVLHTKLRAAWRSLVRFQPLPVHACPASLNGLCLKPRWTVPKILRKVHERNSGCKRRLLHLHPLSRGAMLDHRRPECVGCRQRAQSVELRRLVNRFYL